MADSPGKQKKAFDTARFGRVMRYARPYRLYFWGAMVLAILLAIISPVRGVLIQYTVDRGLKQQPGKLPDWFDSLTQQWSGGDAVKFVVVLTLIQVAIIVVETIMRFFFTYASGILGQNVIKDLRVEVYRKILSFRLRQFDRTPIGTLTTRTINDVEAINEIFSNGFIPIVADMLTIVFTLAAMLWMDWRLTLVSLIPFPLLLIATWYFKESVNKSFIKVRNAVTQLNAFVQEHITGMAIVQAFAAEDREYNKFERINRHHRNANIQAIFAYSVFFPIVEVILAVSLGLLVWWVAGQRLDSGLLIAFVLFLNQIFRPLRFIADKFNVIQMGMVASERVFTVLDNEDTMADAGTVERKLQGEVVFDRVNFAYNPPDWVLRQVSFTIAKGETLAIVGSTGSGKTTIISLLNRLYDATDGSILLDGIPVNEYKLHPLREQIGVVLQDVFLFSGSVLENVTMLRPDISREQVVHAAQLIGIHDFIMQLPGGYDYKVQERAATISAGQRQLISFLRCLLFNPAILVLDEATSNIDTESEQLIQHAIDTMIADRTAIVIAHRLSTIRKADKILVMEKGEVKEIGTHDELLAANGHYSRLHKMQFEQSGILSA